MESPTTSSEMTVHDASDQIQGGKQLNALRNEFFKQQFEQVLNQQTNAERFGLILPLDEQSYENITDKMREGYEKKYDEDFHPPGLSPSFYIGIFTNDPEQRKQEFMEASNRAAKVFNSLRQNWYSNQSKECQSRITSEIPLLASLKEFYIRTQDPSVKADTRRIFDLMSFHLAIFDQNAVLMDCLIDSDQTPQHYLAVFTKLLADERKAFAEGKPVLDKVDQFREQLVKYFNSVGLYFPLPKLEDITYVAETGSFIPSGPIVQQEYARGGFNAIVKNPEESIINIDPGNLTFVARKPIVFLEMEAAEIDRSAISFIATLLHESIHFNGRLKDFNQAPGSWQEAANELITDFTTLTLVTQAGIGKNYDEKGRIPDWFIKTGYHQLIKVAFGLEKEGLVTKEEMIRFGLNQDSMGFIKLLDERLQSIASEQAQKLINSLDIQTVIGPNQYSRLAEKPFLNTEDLFRGVLDFGQELGSFYYCQPGAILYNIKESLPEWQTRTSDEFLDWFRGEGGQHGSAGREARHRLIQDLIQHHQESARRYE